MKKTILSFWLLFISISVFAQFDSGQSSNKPVKAPTKPLKQRTPLRDKIVVGGGLDLRFGDVTVVGITPLVGYKVTDNFLAGGNFTYRYFQDNRYIPTYSTSTFGIAPFLRHTIYKGLFAHAEYEFLYGEFYRQDDPRWINSLLIGGGYGTPVGSNGFIGAYILWNITPDSDPYYRIYEGPQLRISFGIGF